MATKSCKKCGESKPLDGFYVHAMMADGHLSACKECCKAGAKARRDANIEEHRAKDRLRGRRPSSNVDRAAVRRASAAWYTRNKHKVAAEQMARRAVASGALTMLPCNVCATTDGVQAHHDDYSKPLDVVWLCVTHHAARHVALREAARPEHLRREAVAKRLVGRGHARWPQKEAA